MRLINGYKAEFAYRDLNAVDTNSNITFNIERKKSF